jgi:hypothetical protein
MAYHYSPPAGPKWHLNSLGLTEQETTAITKPFEELGKRAVAGTKISPEAVRDALAIGLSVAGGAMCTAVLGGPIAGLACSAAIKYVGKYIPPELVSNYANALNHAGDTWDSLKDARILDAAGALANAYYEVFNSLGILDKFGDAANWIGEGFNTLTGGDGPETRAYKRESVPEYQAATIVITKLFDEVAKAEWGAIAATEAYCEALRSKLGIKPDMPGVEEFRTAQAFSLFTRCYKNVRKARPFVLNEAPSADLLKALSVYLLDFGQRTNHFDYVPRKVILPAPGNSMSEEYRRALAKPSDLSLPGPALSYLFAWGEMGRRSIHDRNKFRPWSQAYAQDLRNRLTDIGEALKCAFQQITKDQEVHWERLKRQKEIAENARIEAVKLTERLKAVSADKLGGALATSSVSAKTAANTQFWAILAFLGAGGLLLYRYRLAKGRR